MEPWGTLEVVVWKDEQAQFIETAWCLSSKYELNHSHEEPSKPNWCFSLDNNALWFTVSNAFERSRKTMPTK